MCARCPSRVPRPLMRVVLRASLVGGGVRVNYDKRKNSLDRIVNFGIVISAVNDSAPCGSVAQLVEQRTENPRVRGSIPFPATLNCLGPLQRGPFLLCSVRGKRISLLRERMGCAFRSLLPTCVYISAHQLVPARPRHSFRFCATLQTVRSSARTRGYTQNDTFPMQYDAGSACTIRRGQ